MTQPETVLNMIMNTFKSATAPMSISRVVGISGLTYTEVMQGMTILRRQGFTFRSHMTWDGPARWFLAA